MFRFSFKQFSQVCFFHSVQIFIKFIRSSVASIWCGWKGKLCPSAAGCMEHISWNFRSTLASVFGGNKDTLSLSLSLALLPLNIFSMDFSLIRAFVLPLYSMPEHVHDHYAFIRLYLLCTRIKLPSLVVIHSVPRHFCCF